MPIFPFASYWCRLGRQLHLWMIDGVGVLCGKEMFFCVWEVFSDLLLRWYWASLRWWWCFAIHLYSFPEALNNFYLRILPFRSRVDLALYQHTQMYGIWAHGARNRGGFWSLKSEQGLICRFWYVVSECDHYFLLNRSTSYMCCRVSIADLYTALKPFCL